MSENCRSENMLTHETANQAQSNMSERAETDKFHTKLTQLFIARNIGVRGNLTKSYINILNTLHRQSLFNSNSSTLTVLSPLSYCTHIPASSS